MLNAGRTPHVHLEQRNWPPNAVLLISIGSLDILHICVIVEMNSLLVCAPGVRDRPYGDLVTTLPTWAVWVLSFGTPALAFLGVAIGQAVRRRGAQELEVRSKRKEVLRILRWAAELAVSDDPGHARLGVAELGALLTSELLDDEEKNFVQAALEAVVRVPVEQIEQLGDDVQVVAETDLPAGADSGVPSGTAAEEERGQR